ncbi:MAG: DUF1415 domain-containing protein [Planctomycetes bacterium]|nr:DUF1415 domain-containing protein [Planctomycetota bacterium]
MPEPTDRLPPQHVVDRTRQWVEDVVLGLDLCPFARPVFERGLIAYVVSDATTRGALLGDLERALQTLVASDPATLETTLLIHPHVLADFLDYNDFLDDADALLEALDLDEHVQVASFHPRYQFADTEPDQIDNYTNRSPFPMLHLLRQASITRARETYPDVEGVPARNIARMQALDPAAQQRLRDAIG